MMILITNVFLGFLVIHYWIFPWEVFDAKDGKPLGRFMFKWQARFFSIPRGLDYARRGEGWV